MTPANDNAANTRPSTGENSRPCPVCGRPASEATRPFCSKRCADVDLHRWLGGHYAIPASPDEEHDAADDPQQ